MIVALVAAICVIAVSSKTGLQGTPVGVRTDEDRIPFLAQHGWETAVAPAQERQVRIPEKFNEVFSRYNVLQLSQGLDLSDYAGKAVTQYIYQLKAASPEAAPVYASLLIHGGRIIGADVTGTAPGGKMQALIRPDHPVSE